MIKKLFSTGGLLSTMLISAALVSLAMTRHQVLALFVVGAIEVYVWLRRHHSSWELLADTYASWMLSLSAVVLVALSPQLITQIAIIIAFIALRLAVHVGILDKYPGIEALVMQFVSLSAVFSAAQVWRWPAAP